MQLAVGKQVKGEKTDFRLKRDYFVSHQQIPKCDQKSQKSFIEIYPAEKVKENKKNP